MACGCVDVCTGGGVCWVENSTASCSCVGVDVEGPSNGNCKVEDDAVFKGTSSTGMKNCDGLVVNDNSSVSGGQ